MTRDKQSLEYHYKVERELADRLRHAAPEARKVLYRTVYNELFRRVPDHPQLTRKCDPHEQQMATERQMQLLNPWLQESSVYLEIGPGDCHLATTVARRVRQVYAVDVSDEIIRGEDRPANFSLIPSDGISIPVPRETVNVAYSHQLLEHLHPDDVLVHLQQVYEALRPGGSYLCVTPHRFSGPHDISKYFDREATGFHLKEYTYAELRARFRQTGFTSTSSLVGIKGRFFEFADSIALGCESILSILPQRLRGRLARTVPLRSGFDSVAIKGTKRL